MKFLLSLLILFSLTACMDNKNTEDSVASKENIEADEFTREEMVEAQLPRLKARSDQEKLLRPLKEPFFEESFMLLNISKTEEEINELPMLFAIHDGEVEITRILPKGNRSPVEVEGTLIADDPDFEVDTIKLKIIDQSFSKNTLVLTIERENLEALPIEFTQVGNGIFADEVGNRYRALSGVLEIAI